MRAFFLPVVSAIAVMVMSHFLGPSAKAQAEPPFIILQSTTSTDNSGLFDHILPLFQAESGIMVRVVAVGTGQAIRNASEGNGDVLLVHAKPEELEFVAQGHGVQRFDLMFNDFVIIGPSEDPAGVADATDAIDALTRIFDHRSDFISRGDDSGTHKAEMRLWQQANIDATEYSGAWYKETGSGMGATLNIARELGAYTLSDRATWLAFMRKGDHKVLLQGDSRLFNQYGITAVNPDRHPKVRAELGERFVRWMVGPTGQAAIAAFRVNGHQVFFPNAR